jgi:hypothetical protein
MELPNGNFKKVFGIEKMVRITPDSQSMGNIKGLELRSKYDHDAGVYHIWIPNEIRDDVDGKSYKNIEPWLLDTIDANKKSGSDAHGKQVFQDVLDRAVDMDKFNL